MTTGISRGSCTKSATSPTPSFKVLDILSRNMPPRRYVDHLQSSIAGLRGEKAFVFIREFVLGSNTTGHVDSYMGKVSGGEDPKLAQDVLPGGTLIFFGDGSDGKTTASTAWPSATVAAWDAFIATATAR